MLSPLARKFVGNIYFMLLVGGRWPGRTMGQYFRTVNPSRRSETDGVAECIHEDEHDAGVVDSMVDVMRVGYRDGAVDLKRFKQVNINLESRRRLRKEVKYQ